MVHGKGGGAKYDLNRKDVANVFLKEKDALIIAHEKKF